MFDTLVVCVGVLRLPVWACRSVVVVIPFGFAWFDSVTLIVFVWAVSTGFD